MRYRSLLVAPALLASALLGCSHNPPPEAEGPPPKHSVLQVVNRNFADFDVYLARFGDRVRLGTAIGNRTTTFEYPSQFLVTGAPVQFEAHPIGGVGSAFTEQLSVRPGDVVTVEIQP